MKIATMACCLAALAATDVPGAPAGAAEPVAVRVKTAPDPAVKQGVMANGLRYAIMRNSTPEAALSLRLAVDVGSYHEADEERGIAHFVEHMAFRSTSRFKEGTLESAFASLGAAFGRDQNAETSLDATVYRLDLPANAPAHVDLAFSWLRDVADGIAFREDAVARERGVLLAERKTTRDMARLVREDIARFQAPHLRSRSRPPIGTDETLQGMSVEQLKSFYQRWYRPENAILVIVGDVPAEQLEAKAKAAFGNWAGKGEPGVRVAAPAAAQARSLEAFSRAEPNFPTAVSACRVAPPDPELKEDVERMRQGSLDEIWTSILDQRLAQLAAGKSSLLGGAAVVTSDIPDAKSVCLVVLPTGDKWQEALASGQAEWRRFEADGPTEVEVETAIEAIRGRLRAAVAQEATRSSPVLANAIVQAELKKVVFAAPREAMRAYNVAVDGLSPKDVKTAFEQDWSGPGPLLAVVGPKVPTSAAILAAWNVNEAAQRLEAYADRAEVNWPYESFGSAGTIAKREPSAEADFEQVVFANGTILRVKKTSFQQNNTEIRIRFGSGRRELVSDNAFQATLGAALFPAGGLGKLPFEDVQRVFANTTWSFEMSVNPDSFILSASPLSSQLSSQLQLLAAYMTDPAFRAGSIDPKLPTVVDLIYGLLRTEPQAVARDALEKAVFADNLSVPPRERLAGLTSSDFERMLKPAITQSPVLITIVGDIDADSAIEAVGESFGALPTRSSHDRARSDVKFQSYPQSAVQPITASHQGPAEKAAALLLWPLYVATPERRQEEYAIKILSQIFDSSLRRLVRERMGKTYSPKVATRMIDHADQGQLTAELEAAPADLDKVVAAAREAAALLAAGKITEQDLEAARQPVLTEIEQRLKGNAAWAEALADDQALRDTLEAVPALKGIVLEDVRKAAATWLAPQPLISKALPSVKQAGSR